MYDITIFYDNADNTQLKRLRKYVRYKKRVIGEKVKCKKAFFNFNLDMIDDVDADEYYFVSHANYEELHKAHGGYIPPIKNDKLTHYIGVSQFATDKLDEYAKSIGSKIKTQRCYNPLTLEPKEKVIHLVSAGRLDDKVKGGERTLKLIDALDKYCERTGRHYIWHIFTNPTDKVNTLSPNIAIMKPRIDVRPYIADADYVLQLSNDMETYCYTINEALGYGVPIVTTPLSILKELQITDNEHIVLDWNCENVDEVARQIFEKEVKAFEYNLLKDNWDKLLEKSKSSYQEEKNMRVKVRATSEYEKKNVTDIELERKPKEGEEFIIEKERYEYLNRNNPYNVAFVELIEVIKEQEEVETAKKDTKSEKAVKKVTKKTK